MKFIIKGDEKSQNMTLFEDRSQGPLIELFQKNSRDRISNIYDENLLIGRNTDIQKIVSSLHDSNKKRITILTGPPGEGKKEIAKFAVKYCSHRNPFKDGAYEIEIDKRQNCKGFLN